MQRTEKVLQKVLEWGIYLFIFLLPWQTRLILKQGYLLGKPWEYGTFSLYGLDILLFLLLILRLCAGGKKENFLLFKKPIQNLWLYLFGLLAISFLSVYWALDAGLAIYGYIKLVEGVLIFWLISSSTFNLKKISLSFLLGVVLQSIIGISEFIFQKSFQSKWLGMALQDPAVSGTSVIETASGRFLRAYGSLPHPNILAGFLVIGLLLLIGLYFHSKKPIEKILILIGSVLISTCLFFTFSRAGFLALVLAVLFILGFAYLVKKPRAWQFSVLRFLAVILLVFIVLTLIYPNLLFTRFSTAPRLEKKSVEQRLNYYQQSFRIISEYWLNGTGINDYTLAIHNEVKPKCTGEECQPVHNVYLLILAELGIFGLAIFLVLWGIVLKTIWQYYKQNSFNDWFLIYSLVLVAIFILFLFDHYFWTLSVGIMLFWFCLGMWQKALEE